MLDSIKLSTSRLLYSACSKLSTIKTKQMCLRESIPTSRDRQRSVLLQWFRVFVPSPSSPTLVVIRRHGLLVVLRLRAQPAALAAQLALAVCR